MRKNYGLPCLYRNTASPPLPLPLPLNLPSPPPTLWQDILNCEWMVSIKYA